jgi:hypothetical protein
MTQEEFDRVFPVEFWREVVDTVKERAPDTLLLAEAFWMMEGYFVRSLGMHRVYNSAFMNMLKREENEKYRMTIKNVLEFDPEILKRFVNFMNNPDEETAVAQFGNDDKYFGVCTLMSTMPGLPMFGHGQVEGFHEKYGMEYRRAKWNEPVNEGLVARHEREIFPLLKKRYLFSGVENFALYDFMSDGGGVDEDVFAYSNRVGDERALVLYNNKFKTTRGRIRHALVRGQSVGEMLGVRPQQGEWLVFRDVPGGLEYIRPLREVTDEGIAWELSAFKYAVLMDFRPVHATREKPYAELAAELAGRGVPSIERAVTQLYYRPVHTPLREALSTGHLAYLAMGWDPKGDTITKEARFAFEEKLQHLADGLAWMVGKPTTEVDAKAIIARATTRFAAVLRAGQPKAEEEAPEAKADGDAVAEPPALDTDVLLAWVHAEAALDLFGSVGPALARSALIDAWGLPLALVDAFTPGLGEVEASRRAQLVLLALTMPEGDLREIMHAALSDPRGRAFMNVHDAGGVTWLTKERFDELARFLAEREAVLDRAPLEDARARAATLSATAEREGFRAEAIAAALAKPREPVVSPTKEPVEEPEEKPATEATAASERREPRSHPRPPR